MADVMDLLGEGEFNDIMGGGGGKKDDGDDEF